MNEYLQTIHALTGLASIQSPWLAAILCNIGLAIVSYLVAISSIWVRRMPTLSPVLRNCVVLALSTILGVALVTALPLSLMAGTMAGLGKESFYLWYVVALYALGCSPVAFVLWRAGVFREHAT